MRCAWPDEIAAADHSFIKPLAFDSAAGDDMMSAVFPDFVLADEPFLTYVEAWGLPAGVSPMPNRLLNSRCPKNACIW